MNKLTIKYSRFKKAYARKESINIINYKTQETNNDNNEISINYIITKICRDRCLQHFFFLFLFFIIM